MYVTQKKIFISILISNEMMYVVVYRTQQNSCKAT